MDAVVAEILVKYRFQDKITVHNVNAIVRAAAGIRGDQAKIANVFALAAGYGAGVVEGEPRPKGGSGEAHRQENGAHKALSLRLALADIVPDVAAQLFGSFEVTSPGVSCTCTWRGEIVYSKQQWPTTRSGANHQEQWLTSIRASGCHDDMQCKGSSQVTTRQREALRSSNADQIHGKLFALNPSQESPPQKEAGREVLRGERKRRAATRLQSDNADKPFWSIADLSDLHQE